MINLLKKHSDFRYKKGKEEEESKIEDYIGVIDEI